jgi:hypothetical protein
MVLATHTPSLKILFRVCLNLELKRTKRRERDYDRIYDGYSDSLSVYFCGDAGERDMLRLREC